MTIDSYKDFVLGLESVEDSYIRDLRNQNSVDERSWSRKVIASFKDFVNKLVAELTKFIDRTKEAARMNFRKMAVKSDMKTMLKNTNNKFGKDATGINIECPDVGRYASEVQKASDKVWKAADKMMKRNYVDINQINNDLEAFDHTFTEAWEAINTAANRRTVMPIESFRAICENEIKGDSIVSRVVSDSIHKMKKAEIDFKYLESRIDSMDANRIVPKKLNAIQRVMSRIVKFCGAIWKGFLTITCYLAS